MTSGGRHFAPRSRHVTDLEKEQDLQPRQTGPAQLGPAAGPEAEVKPSWTDPGRNIEPLISKTSRTMVAAIWALCTAAVLSAVVGSGADESYNATRVVVIGAGASVSSEWAQACIFTHECLSLCSQ